MWDLFQAEARRFRFWALAAAGAHLAVLGFFTKVVDLAQQPILVYRLFAGAYALTGLLLGLFQMGGYRRPNTWLQLLHRPISPRRIAFALTGAGALLLLFAVSVPIALTALAQETLTARVVDTRHYLLAVSATLVAWCGYLTGAYLLLASRRHAVLALSLLALLAAGTATGAWALLFQLVVLSWLFALVTIAFRPDCGTVPDHPVSVVLTALPAMAGVFLLFRGLGLAFEIAWIFFGTHPLNGTPPPGGYIEASRADGPALLEAGLAGANDRRAPLWREQVRISEVHEVGRRYDRPPVRNELTNLAPMEFDDDERRVRWIFSHDTMRFHGVSLADRSAHGELGVGATAEPFPAPALPIGGGFVATSHALYRYDERHQRLWPRLAVPAGETLAGVATEPIGDDVALLSDRALYFFDARELDQGDHRLEPKLRVPVPGPAGDLARIDLIELLDGYLISFLYGDEAFDGAVEAFQQIVRVGADNVVEPIARRALVADGPALWRFQGFWPSPVMSTLMGRAKDLFATPSPLLTKQPSPLPRSIVAVAVALLVLCLGLAAWRVRRLPLGTAARWGWVAACGTIGLPALVSLWLLYPEPVERGAALPHGSPVPA